MRLSKKPQAVLFTECALLCTWGIHVSTLLLLMKIKISLQKKKISDLYLTKNSSSEQTRRVFESVYTVPAGRNLCFSSAPYLEHHKPTASQKPQSLLGEENKLHGRYRHFKVFKF